jgi:uncharacterized membrane protein (UPF0136 family)
LSIVAGLVFGGLFLTSGYLIKENKSNGVELAFGTSSILFGAILPRAIKTRLPVPISLSLIGLSGSLYYGKKLYEQEFGI